MGDFAFEPSKKKLSGWLLKQGPGIIGGWKRRWFELKDNKNLFYYGGPNDKNPNGVIDLCEVFCIGDTDSSQTSEGFRFTLQCSKRNFKLACKTEELRVKWVSAISHLVTEFHPLKDATEGAAVEAQTKKEEGSNSLSHFMKAGKKSQLYKTVEVKRARPKVPADIAEEEKQQWQLHKAIWKGDIERVRALLDPWNPTCTKELNIRDRRGNPALHLAIHTRQKEIVRLLLSRGADILLKNGGGWTALQESIATGDLRLAVEMYILSQQAVEREIFKRSSKVLEAIEMLPDFEMTFKWGFKSWVPGVSRFCPYDTVRLVKCGSDMRADMTLVDFLNFKWIRGHMSVYFHGSNRERPGSLMVVNHDKKTMCCGNDSFKNKSDEIIFREVQQMLARTITRGDVRWHNSSLQFKKSEKVGQFNAKTYRIKGLSYTTIHRHDHDKSRSDKPRSEKTEAPFLTFDEYFYGDTEEEDRIFYEQQHMDEVMRNRTRNQVPTSTFLATSGQTNKANKSPMRPRGQSGDPPAQAADTPADADGEDEFDSSLKGAGLIYTSEAVKKKTRPFKGYVSLSENIPLSLVDLLPVFEIMSPSRKHYERLLTFLTSQMPELRTSFPVKIKSLVLPTVVFTLKILSFERKKADATLFNLPTDYELVRLPLLEYLMGEGFVLPSEDENITD
mmetsp:Transcript_42831/g.108127  ORF Transcript_42831/g.108127 Transcript_42831/m.108127 type:complete len:673 (-) Transcript_42831:32-2050(-)